MTVAVKRARWKKSFKDWRDLNENWCKAVGRDMNRRTMVESASEQVDVRRWQPESSMEGSKWCRSLLAVGRIDLEGLRVWQTLGAGWKARD